MVECVDDGVYYGADGMCWFDVGVLIQNEEKVHKIASRAEMFWDRNGEGKKTPRGLD
jgi:hypothetical protein